MFLNWVYFPFLIITSLIYWVLPKQKSRNLFLTLASLVFIYQFDKKAVIVVLGLTIFTYLFAYWIEIGKNKVLAHRSGIIGLLLVLVVFKYLGFLSGTINSLFSFINQLPVFQFEKLFLPIGISYITFKYISYLTDIYWGTLKKGRFLDLLCYGSLFTIFEAGPIERFERLNPQLESNKIEFETKHVKVAFERIIIGLFQKQVLANRIALFTIPFWKDPSSYSITAQIIGLLGYSLQIYFDFAGYSSIAIGSSRLFGLKIMENFNNPYISTNMTQFWRRWHISLSDWIRDYVYFPMSHFNSKQIWIMIFVPVISMGLCGLWHGSSWNYVLWGIWQGLGIAISQNWSIYKRKHKQFAKSLNTPFIFYAAILVTFIYVSFGWILFKSISLTHITDLVIKHGTKSLAIRTDLLICGLLIGTFIAGIYSENMQKLTEKRFYPYIKWFAYVIIIELIINLSSANMLFIYAGF